MALKILYVCPSSGIGGVETFLQSTAFGHSENVDPHYLLFREGPLTEHLSSAGHNVTVLKKPPRLSRWRDHCSVQKTIHEICRKKNIDLIHGTMAYGALFASTAAKQLKVPFVWFQHGPASGWMDRFAGLKYHQGVLFNSLYTKRKQLGLERPFSFFINKHREMLILPLGTEGPSPSTKTAQRGGGPHLQFLKSQNLSKDTIIFSMLCRVQKWKGVHLFLEALDHLKKQTVPYHGFVWGSAFKGLGYLDQLKSQARKNQTPVTFMGPTDRPNEALYSSHALVNASTQPEPFGLSIIEAMSCARAVVAPNEGGPAEILKEHGSGLLFEPRSSKSLALAMEKLLDPQYLKKVSETGFKIWRRDFQCTQMIQRLEGYYQKVCETKT